MREQMEMKLNVDPETLHDCLVKHVVEDNKENGKKYQEREMFMGKIGAKKFYLLYKPPYRKTYSFMTVLQGDMNEEEPGVTRLKYHFCKFRGAIVFATIIMLLVIAVIIYAGYSNPLNWAGLLCLLGFFATSAGLYLYSMISTTASRERLIKFLCSFEQTKEDNPKSE